MDSSPVTVSPTQRLSGRDRVLLTLITLVMLLPGTFGVSLVDRDEGWYAQVSREMLAGGDWLVPKFLGEPWLAKPPLLYWCVAPLFAVFGLSAGVARMVPVAAMLGAAHLMATLAAQLCGRRAGLLAAVIFVTAGLPVVVGKMLLTDALLLCCTLAAMTALYRVATRGASLSSAALFWLCVGLAVLAKGPAVVPFMGAFGLALLLSSKDRAWVIDWRLWAASTVCVAVAGPWYLLIALRAGDAFGQQFLWYEVTSRLVSAPHGHGGPPGYYVLLSLAGWLPWTPLVVGALSETWRRRRDDSTAKLLLIWCLVPWAFLELIPSKLPHYILPCYVPLAIMVGRVWDLALEHTPTRSQRIGLSVWAAVPVVLGAALVAVAIYWRATTWAPALSAAGATLALGFVAVWQLALQGRLLRAWTGAVGATALFHVLIGVWLLPTLEPARLSRNIAERANAMLTPDSAVYVCGYDEPSMFFYLDAPATVVRSDRLTSLLADTRPERVLIVRGIELAAAGVTSLSDGPGQRRLSGFNYVKGRMETVWVIGPAARITESRPADPVGSSRVPDAVHKHKQPARR